MNNIIPNNVICVSPDVGVDEIKELINDNIVLFNKLPNGMKISYNPKDVVGTCHRVLVMNGKPYCVDSICRTKIFGRILMMPNGGIVDNEDAQKMVHGTLEFPADVEIIEHSNPLKWLNDVWCNY